MDSTSKDPRRPRDENLSRHDAPSSRGHNSQREQGRRDNTRKDEPLVYDGLAAIPSHVLGRYFSSDAQRRAEYFASDTPRGRRAEEALRVLHDLYGIVSRLNNRVGGGYEFFRARAELSLLGARASLLAGRDSIGRDFCKFFMRAMREIDTPGKLAVFTLLFESVLSFYTYAVRFPHQPSHGSRSSSDGDNSSGERSSGDGEGNRGGRSRERGERRRPRDGSERRGEHTSESAQTQQDEGLLPSDSLPTSEDHNDSQEPDASDTSVSDTSVTL
jgi:hypothetical protein